MKKSRIYCYFQKIKQFKEATIRLRVNRYNPKYVFYNQYIMKQYKYQGLFKDKIVLKIPYVPFYYEKLENQKFDLRFKNFNYEMFEHVLIELGFSLVEEFLFDYTKKDCDRRTIYIIKLAQ